MTAGKFNDGNADFNLRVAHYGGDGWRETSGPLHGEIEDVVEEMGCALQRADCDAGMGCL